MYIYENCLVFSMNEGVKFTGYLRVYTSPAPFWQGIQAAKYVLPLALSVAHSPLTRPITGYQRITPTYACPAGPSDAALPLSICPIGGTSLSSLTFLISFPSLYPLSLPLFPSLPFPSPSFLLSPLSLCSLFLSNSHTNCPFCGSSCDDNWVRGH